mgnify:FL=1
MGIIRKKNPQTGEWEICGSTDAKDIRLIDVGDNFEVKNVEGALREMSDKLSETIADMEAHSKTLTEHSDSIEWLKVNGGGGGGGGGGTAAPTITSTFEGGVVDKNEDVKIPIFFSSPNLGTGTAYVMIDNVEVMSVPDIKQGNNTINIGKLTNLKNQVAIYVKDRANMLSNQLSWEIIAGGIECEITFDDTADYFVTDNVVMLLNITSASTEKIMMYITIDYDSYEVELQQGFNEYKFPSLDVGVHKVSFHIESGPYYTPEYIYNLVIVSTNSLYVSSTFQNNSTWKQGFPISVQYRISKASNEYFDVKLYLNGKENKTLKCNPGTYYWTLNDLDVDDYNIKIEVSGAYDEMQTLEFSFKVISSGFEPIRATTDGLIYRLNAKSRTNQDTDREFPMDDSGKGVVTQLHNFNWFSNGWIDGELVCDGEAYVEIDLQPWISNAIYGSTIEIQYTGLDIGLSDAVILDYTDVNTPYKGVSISLEQSVMRSAANTGTVSIDKDVETTISFVIDRESKFGKIYIDGICSRAFFLSDSGAGVNATREDFSHSQKIYLNCKKGKENFGACKIKDFRVYNRILSADEIVLNNIAQIKDIEQQEIVYNFNFNNTTLPTIRMYGDMKNMTLETPVTMRIKYTSPNEDKYGQSFDLP